jgi:peptidoglycan hydrolase-like protein with peptidoglycan-binding domain
MADGFNQPKYFTVYGADGEWGSECAAVASVAIVKRRANFIYPELTKIVQRAAGLTGADVDGKCGWQTHNAIKAYQRKNGLKVDGICGINTWRKILGVT